MSGHKTVQLAVSGFAALCCVALGLPSTANGDQIRILVCTVTGVAPHGSFSEQLCKAMAEALDTRLVPSEKNSPPDATMLELDVKIAGRNKIVATLKIADAKERSTGNKRTSKPIEVSMSDAELNDTAIRSLVESAKFLEESAQ